MLGLVWYRDWWELHTLVLEYKVNFHGVVFIVDAVLARGVEVELGQRKALVVHSERSVGKDNLKAGSKVLKLGVVGLGDVKLQRSGSDIVDVLGVDDDGRLVLALGTGSIGLGVQAIPVQRTAHLGVVVGIGVDDAVSPTSMADTRG